MAKGVAYMVENLYPELKNSMQFKKIKDMQKIVVNKWTEAPNFSLQVHKFEEAEDAFKYAEKEYAPYGFNVACFCKDIKVLLIGTDSKSNLPKS